MNWPDARGRFGEFGGCYAPETLMAPVEELAAAYEVARQFLAPDRVLPAMIEAIYAAKFETRNSKLESNSKSEA